MAPSSSVAPPDPQPGPKRTVGAFAPAASPAAGKKCVAICVPSNDVTVASRADAGGAAASATTSAIHMIGLLRTARPSLGARGGMLRRWAAGADVLARDGAMVEPVAGTEVE